jgi:hypothetical protein
MKKIIILLLLASLSMVSCKKIINSVGSVGIEKLKSENYKTVVINDDYSLDIPKYLNEMKALHDEASFEYANIFKEVYVVVLDESKQEFISLFQELELYDDRQTPLENYADFQVKSIRESLGNSKDNRVNLKIRNISSKHHELHGTVDGIEIGYLLGFVESNEKMYMIMTWTLEERYQKYENTMKTIQESFTLVN